MIGRASAGLRASLTLVLEAVSPLFGLALLRSAR